MKGVLWGTGAVACCVGGALWFLDSTLGSGMCDTDVFAEKRSPDGQITARVQMTDCGATTGFSRVVMLERDHFWKSECRAVALDGEPTVKIEWMSGDILKIAHSAAKADVIASEHVCFGRKIEIVQG
ncbi:MAG TPA: hypothetical protein VF509_04825 [Sphingobium sp.]